MLFTLCPTLQRRCLYPGNKGCPASRCLHFSIFFSHPPPVHLSLMLISLPCFSGLPVRTSPPVSTLQSIRQLPVCRLLSVTYFRDAHIRILCSVDLSSTFSPPASSLRSSLKDFSTTTPDELVSLDGATGRPEQQSLHLPVSVSQSL